MRFYDAHQVHARCDYSSLIAALEQYHREDLGIMDDLLLSQPSETGTESHFFIRAAWRRGRELGAKLITSFPENPNSSKALPATQAVYVLFDGANGEPLAAIDGTALTLRKTAADSALGSRYLSPEDAATMLMVGAGALAPHLIMAHRAIRPSIRRLMVWNRTRSRAQALVDALGTEGLRIEVVDDLEPAARRADLISCATMAREPLIHGEWLKPGAHLDLVGAFTPQMREADDEALRRGSIFVDSRLTTLDTVGELVIPIAAGVITESDVLADLYDLVRGRHPGRRGPQEITLFKNGGGGHLDLMTARFVASAGWEHS
jgi:ornithine cyclodeaminase